MGGKTYVVFAVESNRGVVNYGPTRFAIGTAMNMVSTFVFSVFLWYYGLQKGHDNNGVGVKVSSCGPQTMTPTELN